MALSWSQPTQISLAVLAISTLFYSADLTRFPKINN